MADYNNNMIDRELGWDDAIENDSPEYILLEEGEYEFTVDHLDRERHPGSEKLPPCNKAVLYLNVETPQGVAQVRHNLFMHTRTEGMVCAFFTAIGQRQHGQRITPRWAAVPGAKGRAIFRTREYDDRNDPLPAESGASAEYSVQDFVGDSQSIEPGDYVLGISTGRLATTNGNNPFSVFTGTGFSIA